VEGNQLWWRIKSSSLSYFHFRDLIWSFTAETWAEIAFEFELDKGVKIYEPVEVVAENSRAGRIRKKLPVFFCCLQMFICVRIC